MKCCVTSDAWPHVAPASDDAHSFLFPFSLDDLSGYWAHAQSRIGRVNTLATDANGVNLSSLALVSEGQAQKKYAPVFLNWNV